MKKRKDSAQIGANVANVSANVSETILQLSAANRWVRQIDAA